MSMQELGELLRTHRGRVGLAALVALVITLAALSPTLRPVLRLMSRPLPPPPSSAVATPAAPILDPAPDAPMTQQRPDLEPLIRNAVRSALNEALDTKLSQQTDRVLTGIYAAAGVLAAFMALIAAGVWTLYATVIRQAAALGEIRGFLQAAFPNVAVPQKTAPPAGPPTAD